MKWLFGIEAQIKKAAGFVFIVSLILPLVSFAAEGDILWSSSYDGGQVDVGLAVAADFNNNIIVTGKTWVEGNYYDYYTIKYDPNGNALWSKSYDGANWYDEAWGITTDFNNNIIVTGTSANNYYTIKYDSDGNVLWAKSYDGGIGASLDTAWDVAVDSNNNIVVAGTIYGLLNNNYYTIKYDSIGNMMWGKVYDGGDHDRARGVAIDSANNIIVTGLSRFGTNYNCYTIKYDSNGNVLWNMFYDGGDYDEGTDIITDSGNNIIVTGLSKVGANYNYCTIKYDSSGNMLWSKIYDGGGNDYSRDIATDSNNNIVITGATYGSGNYNYYTIKYDSNGNMIWNKVYDGGNNDEAWGIAVDSNDNIIVTGKAEVGTNVNYYTIKYEGPVPIFAVTVSGLIQYENRPYNEIGNGSDFPELKPVRFADFEIIRASDNFVLASGETNADGTYEATFDATNNDQIVLKCYAYQENYNYNIKVIDSQSNKQFASSANTQIIGSNIFLNLNITEADNAGAFNILDTVIRGSDKVKELNSSVPPLISVIWERGINSGTGYANNTIVLNGSSDDPDEYDDSVILHEYGHFVADKYSYDHSPGGGHQSIDENQDIRLSWSEGWATYFGGLTRNNSKYVDIRYDKDTKIQITGWHDIENLDSNAGSLSSFAQGQDTEVSVSSILWDIYDSTDDTGDILSLGAQSIWDVFSQFKPFYDCVFEDFYRDFFANSLNEAYRVQVNNILAERKLFYSTPLFKRGQIFTKNENLVIPNGTGQSLSSVLSIADNLSISNLNVFVDIDNQGKYQKGNLLLKLISPSGKEIILHNFTPAPIGYAEDIFSWYQPPYETIPDEGLNALDKFNGDTTEGDWILKVEDAIDQPPDPMVPDDIGILNRWKLEIMENQSPELALIGDQLVDEGKLLEFTVSATDPNNQILAYSATNLPQGAYFSPESRLFSWLPNYNQRGEYIVHFEVSDGSSKDFEDVKIIVNEVTIAPISGGSVGIGLKVRVVQ